MNIRKKVPQHSRKKIPQRSTPPTATQSKKWLSKADIIQQYGITLRSLNRYLHEDSDPIPHYKLSHKVLRVDADDFEAWAQRRKVTTSRVDRLVKEVLG